MGISFLKPGAYGSWTRGRMGRTKWRRQETLTKQQSFSICLYFLPARISYYRWTDSLTMYNIEWTRGSSWSRHRAHHDQGSTMGKNLYFHLYIFLFLYFSIEFLRGSVGVVRIGGPWTGPWGGPWIQSVGLVHGPGVSVFGSPRWMGLSFVEMSGSKCKMRTPPISCVLVLNKASKSGPSHFNLSPVKT